jgi:glycerol-3-phosphate dehydrogenase
MLGMGLNMYDVMSWRRGRDEAEEWSPERHRTIDGAEVLDLVPALADREPTAGYLFYDCQTDDVRLVLTVLGEAERFGAVVANRCEVPGWWSAAAARRACSCATASAAASSSCARTNVVNATGVWADRLRPQELYAEEEVPCIRPSRGTHVTCRASCSTCARARSCRRRRADRVRAAVARADADRHHRQRLRGRVDHVRPRRRRRVPARGGERVLRHELGPAT